MTKSVRLPFHWCLRVSLVREMPMRWKFGCKHGLPNFIHCPECDGRGVA